MKRFIKNPWFWMAVFTSVVMTIRIINDIPKPPRIGHTYELAVWSTSEYEGVTAEVIKVTQTGVIAQLNNNSPISIEEQGWTSLQMLRDGEWYAVCALAPIVNPDIGIEETHDVVKAGECYRVEIHWSERLGTLEPGRYRIALSFKTYLPEHGYVCSTWAEFDWE